MELILVLRNLYLRYRANSYISDTEVPVGTTEHFTGTKVPVGTTEHIHYIEVPVGIISRNKSESYHIQGQIRLMQIHIRYGH